MKSPCMSAMCRKEAGAYSLTVHQEATPHLHRADLGPPHIAYKETITKKVVNIEGKHKKQSGGHGQFGDVVLEIKALPRGEGFRFDERVVGGELIEVFAHIVEAEIDRLPVIK